MLRALIHSFMHSLFIHSFMHSLFIHSFTHSFIHSLIHSFIHSFIRSFIHSFSVFQCQIHPILSSLLYEVWHSACQQEHG